MRLVGLMAALLVTLALVPAAVSAEPPPMKDEARLHYERGLALYAEKDYAAAIAALEAGYAIEPRREFLFAEAQAKRLAGDCPGAVPLYQRFLETEPPAAQVNATQIGLARCAQQMAARPNPAPDVQGMPAPAPSPTEPSSAQAVPPLIAVAPLTRPTPWYRDPLGGALLGAGVLGLGVGTGFLVASFSAGDDAADYAAYEHSRNVAEGRRNLAVASLIAGGVLTGAAVTRYVLLRRRMRAGVEISAGLVPSARGGGALVFGGRF